MKRSFVVLLSLVMLLGVFMMTSCEEPTAAVVSKAIKNTAALDSFEAKMTLNIDMKMGGADVSVPMIYDIKAKGMQGDEKIIGATAEMEMLGVEMLVDIYAEGEWSYVTVSGEAMGQTYSRSYKQKLNADDAQYDIESDMQEILKEIPEELLEGVKFTDNEDGSKTVSIVIDDEQFKQMYDDIIESTGAQVGADDLSVTISNATVSVTVDGGYVKNYEMSYDMTMTVEGVGVTASVTAAIEYSNHNGDVTIAPPANYQSFEDIEEMGF